MSQHHGMGVRHHYADGFGGKQPAHEGAGDGMAHCLGSKDSVGVHGKGGSGYHGCASSYSSGDEGGVSNESTGPHAGEG